MLWIILFSFLGGYILSFLVRRVLAYFKILDEPDGNRKIHQFSVVRGGGVAVFLVAFVAFFGLQGYRSEYLGYYVGALIMFTVGLIDDIWDIKPSFKLIGQLIAVTAAILLGLRIEFVTGPGQTLLDIGWLSLPLTFAWLLGITNAINLIDGLDGLAGGVSAITAAVLGIVALGVGRTEVAVMDFVLAASTIGFLPHNFTKKNKMFMGDSGSQFLGFSLAALSILGVTKIATVFIMLIPVLILAIPIFDTLFAIARRMVKRQPIHLADRGHLHHRLLDLGLSQKQVVTFIYYLTALLGIVAVYATTIAPKKAVALFGLTILVVILLSYLIARKHRSKNS